MDASSLGTGSTRPHAGPRKIATAQAKALIFKSGVQRRMEETTGGFIWRVEKWPHWLQVSVDQLGNAEADEASGRKNSEKWFKQNETQVKELLGGVLGDQFGDICIIAKPMGKEAHIGGCCRTGCGSCLKGHADKLLGKIEDLP